MLKKLLLALLVAALALLVIEGGLSLFAGRSLRDGGRPRAAPSSAAPAPPTDEQRRAGALGGTFTVHEDPFVRYTLRPDTEVSFVGQAAHTDSTGQRVRPGPPPPDGALRLIVLGDSVAFGYGLADDQTMAVDLEQLLGDSRGPAARPLACFTVAAPSWNHRSALHYLADHWDALHPDIVVYVPVANDLSDSNDLYETGAQRMAPDPTAADPWLITSRSQLQSIETRLSEGWKNPDMGPVALEADISPESSRRYDENAASIVALHDLITSHGGKLLVLHSELYDYPWHLDGRIHKLRPEVAIQFLERFVPDDFHLQGDMHPNAETVRQRSIVVARSLLERGFVDKGAGAPLPEVSKSFQSYLSPPGDQDLLATRDAKTRADALAKLRPAVDLRTGEGFHQVFGGLNLDGTIRMHALTLLAAKGERLTVKLAPIPDRPDAYPLAVDVDVDGALLGSVQVTTDGCDATLPLPAAVARSGKPIEVRLRPASWIVIKDRGRSETASCFLVRLSSD